MTGEQARGYKWADATPGNRIALKHGIYASDVVEVATNVAGDLLPPSVIERFPAMSLVFAETWVRWRRALADIDKRGMVIGDDEKANPVLGYEGGLRRSLLELSQRFGLDPRSDVELQRSKAEGTLALVDLEAIA